jgi:hypothetical protein
VRHLGTNFKSPQYHVVEDDLFETIHNVSTISEHGAESVFSNLFENTHEHYAPTECNKDCETILESPHLDDMWLRVFKSPLTCSNYCSKSLYVFLSLLDLLLGHTICISLLMSTKMISSYFY